MCPGRAKGTLGGWRLSRQHGDGAHVAIKRLTAKRQVELVVKDRRLAWPDSLAVGPDGVLYVSTSQIHRGPRPPEPYRIFKLVPTPGGRAWREDVLVCGRCGGAMLLIAVIEAPAVIEKIPKHLGLWQRGPPRGRRVVVESRDHETPEVN